MAQIIDGKAVSRAVRARVAQKTLALKEQGVTPGLAVILVGEDPASQVYVRNKEKACDEVGFYSEKYTLPADTTQAQLNALVDELNAKKEINGILCQLPLPPHLSDKEVIARIDPAKDVDAFHPENVGAIMIGDYRFPFHRHGPDRQAGGGAGAQQHCGQANGYAAAARECHSDHCPFQDTEFGRADQAGGCVGGGSGSS